MIVSRLEDLTGYDLAVAVAKEFATAFPDRAFISPVVDLLIKNGRNGNLLVFIFVLSFNHVFK